MRLPRANLNPTNNFYEALILISVKNSVGAVKNVTKIVQVNPNSQTFENQIINMENLIVT